MIHRVPKSYRKLSSFNKAKKKHKYNVKTNRLSWFEENEIKKSNTYVKISKEKVEVVADKPKSNFIYSKGEAKIKEILDKYKIKYVREKTFRGCKNPKTKMPLRFDFYLPKYKTCIEYDGLQHHVKLEGVSGKEFNEQVYRDTLKNKYCKDKEINLLRIPSRKFSQIEKILLEEVIKSNLKPEHVANITKIS